MSCSVALGSAVVARPTESEEIRGVKAALDDVLHEVLVSAVPMRPGRAGIGKGIGQRDRVCSLATSVRVAVERHGESGELCGEVTAGGIADGIARGSEECLADFGMLVVLVDELEGLSAEERWRRVVALRSFLEAGVPVNTPAEATFLAEVRAALL